MTEERESRDTGREILANTLQEYGWKKTVLPMLEGNMFELRGVGPKGNTVIVKVWSAGFVAISDSYGPVASCGMRVPTSAIVVVAESVRSLTV